jgi:hypothetical protein
VQKYFQKHHYYGLDFAFRHTQGIGTIHTTPRALSKAWGRYSTDTTRHNMLDQVEPCVFYQLLWHPIKEYAAITEVKINGIKYNNTSVQQEKTANRPPSS